MVALFLVGLAAVAEPGTVPETWRNVLGVAFGIGFLGLVLWLPVVLVLHYNSIRPTTVTADNINLAGVSPAFVESLKEHRRAHPGERPHSFRTGFS